MRMNVRWFVLALCGALGGCCFGGGQHAVEVAALGAVCSGTAAPAAPAYVRGPGQHPLFAMRQGLSSGRWSQAFGMLTTRTPGGSSVATTQLVLCIEPEQRVELGRCAFDSQLTVGFVPVPGAVTGGPSFARVRKQQRVRIVAARTAETIGDTVLQGSEPPSCDHSIVGHPSDADFRGGDVGDFTINAWAEPYGLGTAP